MPSSIISSNLEGTFTVDSLDIAQGLGKQHKDLLRIIRSTCSSVSKEISRRNLAPSTYIDSRGKTRAKYVLTQTGVVILMSQMQDSLGWFVKLSEAFVEMQKTLIVQQKEKISRLEGKESSLLVTTKNRYGTSRRRIIPNEIKTFLKYTEGKAKRKPVKDATLLELAQSIFEQAEYAFRGWQEKFPRYVSWIRAVEIAEETGRRLPLPSKFQVDSSYEFAFKNQLALPASN